MIPVTVVMNHGQSDLNNTVSSKSKKTVGEGLCHSHLPLSQWTIVFWKIFSLILLLRILGMISVKLVKVKVMNCVYLLKHLHVLSQTSLENCLSVSELIVPNNFKWHQCLSRPCYFKFFKDCLPQISLGPFLNTLSQKNTQQHTDLQSYLRSKN